MLNAKIALRFVEEWLGDLRGLEKSVVRCMVGPQRACPEPNRKHSYQCELKISQFDAPSERIVMALPVTVKVLLAAPSMVSLPFGVTVIVLLAAFTTLMVRGVALCVALGRLTA